MTASNPSPTTQKDPIRIVRIIARLNVGGPAIHVILLSERMRALGYDTLLVSGKEADHEGDMLYLAEERGVEPLRLPALGRELHPIKDLCTLWKLIRILRRTKPHIVHTHTAKAGTLGRLAALLSGVPVIIHTFHGHVFSGYFSDRKTRLFLAVERFLARHSTRVIGVSEKCCADLRELGVSNHERLQCIPLGLELERFPKAAEQLRGKLRNRFGLGPELTLIAIVARMVPIKRHDVFLRAVAMVCRDYPNARFLIVGDGSTRPEMERLAEELGICDVLVWTGFIDDPAEVYADVDLVALTSDDEGLPVAVIESLSSGRPVVSTSVGGVPELIEEGVSGFMAEPGRPEDFARALRLGLEALKRIPDPHGNPSPGCLDMKSAQERIIKKLSIDRLVKDLDSLYRQCLDEVTNDGETRQ